MKKIRVILAATAIVLSASGIYVQASRPATTYWVPAYANRSAIAGEFCDLQIVKPCNEGFAVRCTVLYSYSDLGNYTVIVSKEDVGTGDCSAFFKN